MLTKRDIEVIEFIKKFKIADTKMIAEKFYKNINKAQHRLSKIIKETEINRKREIINEPYYYFYKKPPSQIKHSLKVTEFYVKFSKIYEIKKFMIEKQMGRIKPDASFTFIENNIQKIGLLEVELSNKGFNYAKYENWFKYEEWKKYMTIKPKVYIISKNKKANVNETNYEYIDISLNEMGNNPNPIIT